MNTWTYSAACEALGRLVKRFTDKDSIDMLAVIRAMHKRGIPPALMARVLDTKMPDFMRAFNTAMNAQRRQMAERN